MASSDHNYAIYREWLYRHANAFIGLRGLEDATIARLEEFISEWCMFCLEAGILVPIVFTTLPHAAGVGFHPHGEERVCRFQIEEPAETAWKAILSQWRTLDINDNAVCFARQAFLGAWAIQEQASNTYRRIKFEYKSGRGATLRVGDVATGLKSQCILVFYYHRLIIDVNPIVLHFWNDCISLDRRWGL